MAITRSQVDSEGVERNTAGSLLDDAATPAAVTLTPGFTPVYVAWINVTDRITWEWFTGAADGTTLKTAAAGTRTLDTADVAITVNDDDTITIAAAVVLQNKQYRYIIR